MEKDILLEIDVKKGAGIKKKLRKTFQTYLNINIRELLIMNLCQRKKLFVEQ